MAKFKAGDTAYILESNRFVTEVKIVKYAGGMFLIKLPTGGGIKVKEHRLYATKEEAETACMKESKVVRHRNPYDYMQ